MSATRTLSGSFWPNSVQETLLRVAFSPADEVAARWREVGSLRVESLEVGTLALLPVVFARLLEAGVDDPRIARLKGTHHSIWYRNQLQLARLGQLAEAFRAANVEPLMFGGAPLAAVYYDQLGMRPIVQLELVVDPNQVPEADAAVEGLGWRRAGARYQAQDAAVHLVLHKGAPPYLASPLGPSETLRLWRSRARQHEIGGSQMLVLCPTDELVVACGLGARRTVPQSPQWIVDVRTILTSSAPGAQDVAERASELHLVPAVRDTLAYLANLSSFPDLTGHHDALRATRSSRRDAIVHRIAGAGAGRLGAPPALLVAYARSTVAMPLRRTLTGLPDAFKTAWGLEAMTRVPGAALRKAVLRLRPRDDAHSSSHRNTSASS